MSPELQDGRNELSRLDTENVEKTELWIGADVKMDDNLVVEKGSEINKKITVTPEQIDQQALQTGRLFYSTRSTLAQQGIEVYVLQRATEQMIDSDLSDKNELPISISVKNWGYSPVELRAGDDLFRFFSSKTRRRVEGSELSEHIFQNEVIRGEYGRDWWLIDAEGNKLAETETELASIVCLSFDPDKRLWVPPSDRPTHITGRADLEKMVKPVPAGQKTDFCLFDTRASIQPAGRPAVLFSGFNPGFESDSNNFRQILSTLIDKDWGGGTGKSIRLEIIDPKNEARQKPFVYMEFL